MHQGRVGHTRLVPFALGALVLLGAALRVERLGSTPLNFDESFTAMAGRLPLGNLFIFLRTADSHPPLDYLLQLPLARLGANPFVFRLPAALCSIAALALFAWWMRDRGRVGVAATAAMAICAFQIAYGREARMYGPMELIGVGTAVVAESWLRNPRRAHPVIIGALTFVGLMTHISMALMAVGLLVLPGKRRDADAWRWRGAVAAGVAGWALVWGPSFLVQSRGGHSSWIPHTTPARFLDTISSLVTSRPGISALVVAAVVAGAIVCVRRDRNLAMVLVCCSAIPALLAGLLGLRAPVLLNRTLTVAAWGPLLAIGYLVDAAFRRARVAGTIAAAGVALLMLASVPAALNVPGPTAALTELDRVAQPGDVIAIQPPSKGVELYWTIGVRSDDGPARAVQIKGIHDAVALALTARRPTGRIWLMQLSRQPIDLHDFHLCAHTWHNRASRMLCIRHRYTRGFPHGTPPNIAAIYAEFSRHRAPRSSTTKVAGRGYRS
jgi:Dolichyl-phosphate-mannose-protein mannosyltransferase